MDVVSLEIEVILDGKINMRLAKLVKCSTLAPARIESALIELPDRQR